MAYNYKEYTTTPNGTFNIYDTLAHDVVNYSVAVVNEPNLVPENIKSGISILGVPGTLQTISTVTDVPTVKTTDIIYNATTNDFYIWKEND